MADKQYLLQYGLIGFPLGHSFSKRYFTEKFQREGVTDAVYDLFPLEQIEDLPALLDRNPDLVGLNVTIPYKQAVMPYLNAMDETAAEVGAVNCIQIQPGRYLKGYNTDTIGFELSLKRVAEAKWATPGIPAFVLGDGGAAQAVVYVLKKLGMQCCVVSRKSTSPSFGPLVQVISWSALPAHLLNLKDEGRKNPVLIVNTTPLGMAPAVEDCPDLPFDALGPEHLVFDLIYNPEETLLLQRAKKQGCTTLNGLEMLQLQAEAAWKIWNDQ